MRMVPFRINKFLFAIGQCVATACSVLLWSAYLITVLLILLGIFLVVTGAVRF